MIKIKYTFALNTYRILEETSLQNKNSSRYIDKEQHFLFKKSDLNFINKKINYLF